MFPVLASLQNDNSLRRYKVLGKSLALMSVLTLPTYFVIAVFPEFVIKIIVGVKYLSIAEYLPSFALAMLFLTLLTVLSQYFLALAKQRGLVVLTIVAIIEVVLLLLFHNNILEIIRSLTFVFGSGSMAMIILLVIDFFKARRIA
jgi:O-antigen/teichoic acid export membrane protein